MKYLGWAVFYEGKSDAFYLDVVIPKIIRNVIANSSGEHIIEVPDQPSIILGRNGREVEKIAAEACEFFAAFEILFLHSDQGGRGLQRTLAARSTSYCDAMEARCAIAKSRCLSVTPKHETEAWVLADSRAVLDAVGIVGNPADFGLPQSPQEAERLVDPKATLRSSLDSMNVRKRARDVEFLFPAIANRQDLNELYRISVIRSFRDRIRDSLTELEFIS